MNSESQLLQMRRLYITLQMIALNLSLELRTSRPINLVQFAALTNLLFIIDHNDQRSIILCTRTDVLY